MDKRSNSSLTNVSIKDSAELELTLKRNKIFILKSPNFTYTERPELQDPTAETPLLP